LVTNGDFATDVSGWTLSEGDGTIAHSAGGAVVTYGTAATTFSQTFALVIGKVYTVVATLTGGTSSIRQFYYRDAADVGLTMQANQGIPQSATFTATTTSLQLKLRVAASGTGIFDNVSVRLAEEDRSVNGNGLQVFGSITKNPVATGAELMGYNEFSATNYLEQPYNSDLDFGTGDFCVMGWVKYTSTGGTSGILSKGVTTLGIAITVSTSYVNVYVANTQVIHFAYSQVANVDIHLAAWRNGTTVYLAINGVIVASTTAAADTDIANSTLRFGKDHAGSTASTASLALWRISATAPSAAQIAKIYEDEKFLFQENAACTLYGASDAVTALAHDPVTDLLHVGTSQGRSDFAGLRRVNNTTTAVGVSISAVDGLIVED